MMKPKSAGTVWRAIIALVAIGAGSLTTLVPATSVAWGPDIYYEFRYDDLTDEQSDAVAIVSQYFKGYFEEVQVDTLANNREAVRIGIAVPVNVGDSYRAGRLQMEIIAIMRHPRLCRDSGCPIAILHRRKLTDEWYDVFLGISNGQNIVDHGFPNVAWCIETNVAAQYVQWFDSRLIISDIEPNRDCWTAPE